MSAAKRRRPAGGFGEKATGYIINRAQWRCESCGTPVLGGLRGVTYSLHHRAPRGIGGSSAGWLSGASNGLLLCGSGTTGCHGWVEKNRNVARADGFLVPTNGIQRPLDTPVRTYLYGLVLLDDLGGFVFVD